jgi:MFS transporter, FSR family, fosmidomycin resistance protein
VEAAAQATAVQLVWARARHCRVGLAGTSAGIGLLVVALFVSGLGASTQHPLASSLMAHAFAVPRSMKARGTYNFAGDVGKMTVPAAVALLLVVMPWRPALALLGALGILAGIAISMLTPRYGTHSSTAPAPWLDSPRLPSRLQLRSFD